MSFVYLPWLLTWFAHSLERFETVARCWDVLIADGPAAALYLITAVRHAAPAPPFCGLPYLPALCCAVLCCGVVCYRCRC